MLVVQCTTMVNVKFKCIFNFCAQEEDEGDCTEVDEMETRKLKL